MRDKNQVFDTRVKAQTSSVYSAQVYSAQNFLRGLEGNENAQQNAINKYEEFRGKAEHSALKKFEELTPIFIKYKINKALEESKSLNSQELFGIKDGNIDTILETLETNIENRRDKNPKLNNQDAFKEICKTSWWSIILDFLGVCLTVDSQIKNVKNKIIQKILESRKEQITRKIKDFTLKNEQNAQVESANSPKQYTDNDDDEVFIKDINSLKSLKGLFYNKITGIKSEGIREYFGAEFMKAMGVQAPKTQLILNDKGDATKVASYSVGTQTLSTYIGIQRESVDSESLNKIQEFKSNHPYLIKQIIKLHAISFLMGNRDLHMDNIIISEDGRGDLNAVPIDFGLCAHDMSVVGKPIGGINLGVNIYGSKFNVAALRHRDANHLFDDQAFEDELKKVVEQFKNQQHKMLDKIFYDCATLGASDAEINTLRKNIDNNVKLATNFIGGPSNGIM
jgi:hypothetical protein